MTEVLVTTRRPGGARGGSRWPRSSLATVAAAAIIGLCSGCGISATPHAVGALADDACLQCHRGGEYGAASIDHADRRHCVSCHEVRDLRLVPHSLALSDCLSCHEQGASGAPATSHPDRVDCARCHASAE